MRQLSLFDSFVQQTPTLSPIMRQYHDLKQKHPDALLLFRCGEFYETYYDDATEASRILGITMTKHQKGYALAGFPFYALDVFLPKLIRAGKRVAICDQLEDPRQKKLVKRGYSEMVCPYETCNQLEEE